jgi:hypothetical protein
MMQRADRAVAEARARARDVESDVWKALGGDVSVL